MTARWVSCVAAALFLVGCESSSSVSPPVRAAMEGGASGGVQPAIYAADAVGAAPNYSAYKKSYFVPYSGATKPDFNKLGSLSIRTSINGGPVKSLNLDTGSWGILIGAQFVPNIPDDAPPGSILYSSSGNGFEGVYANATVTFPDSDDGHGNKAEALVPVLAAKLYRFTPGAVNTKAGPATTRANPTPYMMGVGSGRGPDAHQERNPWVNLKEMRDGTMRRGYILTDKGVTLGLTKESVGDGWVFEKLKPHVATTQPTTRPSMASDAKDWDSCDGWVEVGGKRSATCGVLLDTGLTNFIVWQPELEGQVPVPDGTPVTVHLLNGKLKYSFAVGDKANPSTPSKMTYAHTDKIPLINTGLRALATFDYLYDADGGYIGLRPRVNPPSPPPAKAPATKVPAATRPARR
jgi:hypothetical protein